MIWGSGLIYLQLIQIKVIHSEVFPFGPFEVYLSEEQSVSNFVSVVDFVIFGNDGFVVLGKNVSGDLLKIGFEIFNKVLEDVSLVGLEVQLQEHVMGNYYG